jgi:hypothetical protein
MSAVTVKDLVPGMAIIAGNQLSNSTGRPVQVVMVAIDLCGDANDIAIGAFNLTRENLILALEGVLGAPSTAPMLSLQGRYVPPRVVRREGSCTKHLPSRYGDRLAWGGRI